MGIERTLRRKQQHEVKKMYDREMRKMAGMTDLQKVTHLEHLSRNIKTVDPNNNMVQTLQPIDVDELLK